jgi:hypothetical protein
MGWNVGLVLGAPFKNINGGRSEANPCERAPFCDTQHRRAAQAGDRPILLMGSERFVLQPNAGLSDPHHIQSEQQKIEFNAPEYLKNVIRIVTKTGARALKKGTFGT